MNRLVTFKAGPAKVPICISIEKSLPRRDEGSLLRYLKSAITRSTTEDAVSFHGI